MAVGSSSALTEALLNVLILCDYELIPKYKLQMCFLFVYKGSVFYYQGIVAFRKQQFHSSEIKFVPLKRNCIRKFQ